MNDMAIKETLQEKFRRLIINAPSKVNNNLNAHQNITSKLANMSLQDMHAKVQEIAKQPHIANK